MLKKLLVFTLVAVLALSLVACGGVAKEEPKADASAQADTQKQEEKKADAQPAKKKLIGFANLTDEIDFGQAVKKGIVDEAKKAGYEIVSLDNKLDGATAVSNADNLITQKIDFFIEFNVDSKVAPAIMEKMNAAKIPVIAIDIPHPGAVFFGADNKKAGIIAGNALAERAKKDWNGQVDLVILVENPAAGEVPQMRMDGTLEGIRQSIPVDDKKVVRVDGKNDVLNAQRVVTDTLTAHPDAKHILIGCLNDQNGQGSLAAVEAANRADQVFIASQGADKPAIDNLRAEKANCWIGSTAYTPEKYGSFIIPLATKMLSGEKVADVNHPEHFFLSRDNINEKYPK